jgi:hypothetical protein
MQRAAADSHGDEDLPGCASFVVPPIVTCSFHFAMRINDWDNQRRCRLDMDQEDATQARGVQFFVVDGRENVRNRWRR